MNNYKVLLEHSINVENSVKNFILIKSYEPFIVYSNIYSIPHIKKMKNVAFYYVLWGHETDHKKMGITYLGKGKSKALKAFFKMTQEHEKINFNNLIVRD